MPSAQHFLTYFSVIMLPHVLAMLCGHHQAVLRSIHFLKYACVLHHTICVVKKLSNLTAPHVITTTNYILRNEKCVDGCLYLVRFACRCVLLTFMGRYSPIYFCTAVLKRHNLTYAITSTQQDVPYERYRQTVNQLVELLIYNYCWTKYCDQH